ncbi:MAG TPA: universal stress protein, partial [Luteolibacter sp.]|nr:universal stress protein [Luteolibacter sp.]
ETMMAENCPGVPGECDVRVGSPPTTLARILTDHRADLLVLGAHDLTKCRLGTVAAACARSAPADVLILRDWQGHYFRRIAACVDFSDSSSAGLDRAITFAEAHEAALEIIHVLYPPDRDPWGRVMDQPMDADTDYGQRVRERASAAMDEFLQPHAARLAKVVSTVHFLESVSPSAAITAHLEAGDIDLVVTGSHAGSRIEDLVLGSNTERMLHDSTGSVLVARGWNVRRGDPT